MFDYFDRWGEIIIARVAQNQMKVVNKMVVGFLLGRMMSYTPLGALLLQIPWLLQYHFHHTFHKFVSICPLLTANLLRGQQSGRLSCFAGAIEKHDSLRDKGVVEGKRGRPNEICLLSNPITSGF